MTMMAQEWICGENDRDEPYDLDLLHAMYQKKMMSLENLYGSGNHNRFPGFFVL